MNKTRAQQKICRHITRHQGKEITATPQIARYWWRILNEAIFDNNLKPPKRFSCRNFKSKELGWCQPKNGYGEVVIGIRKTLPDKKTFITVLVHEMVHQYEWHTGYPPKHGKRFFEWKERIQSTIKIPLSRKVEC